MKKVSIIGAGNVGSVAALHTAMLNISEVVLIDIVEGVPQGKALDIEEAGSIHGFDTKLRGSQDYKDINNSDVVVVTAGLPRKPGMSRDDLLKKNIEIMKTVSENIKRYAPNSIVIVVTNPLDAMAYALKRFTGFDSNKVIGMAGVLDTARFKSFIAMDLQIHVKDIHSLVLGGHGDTMVPLTEYTTISGINLEQLMEKNRINELVERTKAGGAEIVNLLKTGSAYYAPGAAVAQMTESIIFDRKMTLPCSVFLQGEYALKDIFFGVPIVLGSQGVEKIIELELSEETKTQIQVSAQAVLENKRQVDSIIDA